MMRKLVLSISLAAVAAVLTALPALAGAIGPTP
jgi:hypothetical protein